MLPISYWRSTFAFKPDLHVNFNLKRGHKNKKNKKNYIYDTHISEISSVQIKIKMFEPACKQCEQFFSKCTVKTWEKIGNINVRLKLYIWLSFLLSVCLYARLKPFKLKGLHVYGSQTSVPFQEQAVEFSGVLCCVMLS